MEDAVSSDSGAILGGASLAAAAEAFAVSQGLPPLDATDIWDMAALRAFASAPLRQFRSLLTHMVKGLHFEHAIRFMQERSALVDLEFSADDVNEALAHIVFCKESSLLLHLMATWKKQSRLVGRSDEDLLAEARSVLDAYETGPMPQLRVERFLRSSEIHEDNIRRKLGLSVRSKADGDGTSTDGSYSDGGAPRKRARVDASVCEGEDAPAPPAALPQSDPPEVRAAFKHGMALLNSNFGTPGRCAAGRLRTARRIFECMCEGTYIRPRPNARTFILMLAAALQSGAVEYGQTLFRDMQSAGLATASTLYKFAQPSFMCALTRAGMLEDDPALLAAERGSPKWCFLTAAALAHAGDMRGSKHGAVLVKDGVPLTWGHNHRFAPEGDPHVRVMHAEVHCLVRLPDIEQARGAEVYIVELDGQGVGYEEAIPCPMCNTGIYQFGLHAAHYSAHDGIRTQVVRHSPHLHCEAYFMAKRRTYPKSTRNPDAASDEVVATAVPAPPAAATVLAAAAPAAAAPAAPETITADVH